MGGSNGTIVLLVAYSMKIVVIELWLGSYRMVQWSLNCVSIDTFKQSFLSKSAKLV